MQTYRFYHTAKFLRTVLGNVYTAQSTDGPKSLGCSYNPDRYCNCSHNSQEVVGNSVLKLLLLPTAPRAPHRMCHKMKVGNNSHSTDLLILIR